MNEGQPSRIEQMLDLLTEEIRERLARAEPDEKPIPEVPRPLPGEDTVKALETSDAEPSLPSEETAGEAPEPLISPAAELGPDELPPAGTEPSHAARLMRRLAVWLFVAIMLVNIPLSSHGTTLATAMPDAASYIVRDGFVVKEADDQEIYVYQNRQFRWISSLDAFEHYGYTWKDVHIVPDGYLDRYEIGSPIHVLLKCDQSPHIYRLEEGKKRWIRDITTFVAEGHVWDDVRFVSCHYLRNLPDGDTIPSDAGPPPQP